MAFYLDNNVVEPPSSGYYKVVYEANGTTRDVTVDIRADVNDTSLVDLERDDEYTFKVYFFDDSQFSRVAISTCTVDTNVRRGEIVCFLASSHTSLNSAQPQAFDAVWIKTNWLIGNYCCSDSFGGSGCACMVLFCVHCI